MKKRLRAKQEIEQKLKQEAEDVATIHARAKQHLSMEEREELQHQQDLLRQKQREEAIQVEEQAAKGVKRPHAPIGASKTEQEEEFKHNPEQQKEYLRTQAYKYGFNPDTFTQELLNQIQAQEEFEMEQGAKKSKPSIKSAKKSMASATARTYFDKEAHDANTRAQAQAKHEADIRPQAQAKHEADIRAQAEKEAQRRAYEADMRAQQEADRIARQEAQAQQEAQRREREAHIRMQQEAELRQKREDAARLDREIREDEEREQKREKEKEQEKKQADDFAEYLEKVVKNWNVRNGSKPISFDEFVYTYPKRDKARIALQNGHPEQRKAACELCLEYTQLLVEKLLGKNKLDRSHTIAKNFKQLSLIYHTDKRERYPNITDKDTWQDIYQYINKQSEVCRSAKNCPGY